MVNYPNKKKNPEHFNFIEDIMNDGVKLAIAIGVIVLIIILAVFLLMRHNNSQSGSGIMEFLSDTSPMAPLTATPAM